MLGVPLLWEGNLRCQSQRAPPGGPCHIWEERWKVDPEVVSLPQLEKCAQDLGSTSKAVGSSMAQLLTCAAQGNEDYTGTNALCPFSRAAPGEARGAGIPALPSHLTSAHAHSQREGYC